MSSRRSAFHLEDSVPSIDFHNADEMIRANGAAEAAELEKKQSEIDEYRKMLDQLQQLARDNQELVQKLQFMNVNTTDSIKKAIDENNERMSAKLDEMSSWDPEAFQETMQGHLQEEIRTQVSSSGEKVVRTVLDAQDRNEELHQSSDAFNHKENVRVYRNVQASTITELQKQTNQIQAQLDTLKESLNQSIEAAGRPTETQKLYRKAMMIIVSVVLALQVAEGFGLITVIMNLLH